MNTNHVKGLIIRNLYIWIRDLDRLFDAFWWGFFDVVIWGFLSTYFRGSWSQDNVVGQMLTGIVFWGALARSQWEVSASILIESWEKNFINIFTAPLSPVEFLTSTVLLGFAKLLIVFSFTAGVTYLFYQFNIFVMSWWIAPPLLSLFMTSVWVAFVINAMILHWGKNVMSFAWTLVLIINPISGVVYPISALPPALQTAAWSVPSSYVFEGMRAVLATGTMDVSLFITSFVLNGVYLLVSILFYAYTFKKARENGWLIKLV